VSGRHSAPVVPVLQPVFEAVIEMRIQVSASQVSRMVADFPSGTEYSLHDRPDQCCIIVTQRGLDRDQKRRYEIAYGTFVRAWAEIISESEASPSAERNTTPEILVSTVERVIRYGAFAMERRAS